MRINITLPTPADGVDGLLGLADLLAVSDAEVYRFLGFLRDNVNGGAVVLAARRILAARIVRAHASKTGEVIGKARATVADELGIPAPQRPHFNRLLRDGLDMAQAHPDWIDKAMPANTLPTAADGVAGLLGLRGIHGITHEQLFTFLGWIKHSTGAKLVGQARQILAARLVLKRINLHPTEDLETAQLAVAKMLGYPTHHRPNFYKRVKGGLELLAERGER
jgi:hypothetical protein